MQRSFSSTLSQLRRDRDLSQRKLSADLNISQALLSHYENGSREPGLPFVCRACDYFGVSADYLLGRSDDSAERLECNHSAPENELHGLLRRADSGVRTAATDYLDAAAKRVAVRLTQEDDELSIAELSARMADAELALLRSLSENNSNP